MQVKDYPIVVKVFDDNDSNEFKITMPKVIYNELITDYQTILKVGKKQRNIDCCSNDTKNIFELSDKMLSYFGLCKDKITNLIVKENVICLGPVIGIFVSNGSVKHANIQNPNFRLIETMNCNKISNSIVYYFSVKDVDFEKEMIRGTYLNELTGRWEKKEFPYPDVLYDRGGGTLKSQLEISDYIREELELDSQLKKINCRYYFDKWDVHKELSKRNEMKKYLPCTIQYSGKDSLIEMFSLSKTLYVKDRFGNNGIGVARAIKFSEEKFELSHFNLKNYIYKLNSFEELINKIDEVFNGKKLIVQTAIDLLKINNHNIDMRATVQKNGEGKVQIIALPVRAGKQEYPITTTRSGAVVYAFEDFFRRHYDFSEEKMVELRYKINEFLFTCFNCVEDAYGNFGELGIDFALDKDFKIWFIECNAKPGKDTLYLSYDDETIKKAFLNPLEYAKYLWKNA